MTAWSAWRDGVRRVNGAPIVLLGMFSLTLLLALPLSIALRRMIADHLGDSLFADTVASGTSYDWWQEFSAQASGLGTTFVPSIIGFGAVLDNVGGLLDNLPMAATIAGATAAWLVLWSFLSGGVLDRYARMRPTRDARVLRRVRNTRLALSPHRAALTPRVLGALRARPPVALRRRLSVGDARHDR